MRALLLILLFACNAVFAQDNPKVYVTVQGGVSHIGGDITTSHLSLDANPHGLPFHIADSGAMVRAAVGVKFRNGWAAELGYGRLGHYSRSLAFKDSAYSTDDFVGQEVAAQAVDARVMRYFLHDKRLQPYIFGTIGLVAFQRDVWDGHNADGTPKYDIDNIEQTFAQWKHDTGTLAAFGGGIGAEYLLTKHVSLTAEFSALAGQLTSQSLAIGVRYNF